MVEYGNKRVFRFRNSQQIVGLTNGLYGYQLTHLLKVVLLKIPIK